MSKKVAIAYIPVLHKGYVDFLSYLMIEGVGELWLIGDEIIEAHEELDYINRKDRLRAVPIPLMVSVLQKLTDLPVRVLSPSIVPTITVDTIVTPREDIGRVIVEKYFPDKQVEFYNVFLRRNQDNVGENKEPLVPTVSASDFQNSVWGEVLTEAEKSADWWLQVGAALVKDGEVLFIAHNEHLPEEQLPNIEGDSRSLFKKGIKINYVTAVHAEASVIGEAAKRGIATAGAELYVTHFPCPYCARVIAASGIKKLYFKTGYAVLDGDDFLKGAGVEVVKVV